MVIKLESVKTRISAFPPLPTRPQLVLAVYPALFFFDGLRPTFYSYPSPSTIFNVQNVRVVFEGSWDLGYFVHKHSVLLILTSREFTQLQILLDIHFVRVFDRV